MSSTLEDGSQPHIQNSRQRRDNITMVRVTTDYSSNFQRSHSSQQPYQHLFDSDRGNSSTMDSKNTRERLMDGDTRSDTRREEEETSAWAKWLEEHEKVDTGLEYLKRAFYLLLLLAIFLGTAAAIGAAMYASILAMPVIAASLSAVLGLALIPQAAIAAVAALALIGTVAVAWKWLEIQFKAIIYYRGKFDYDYFKFNLSKDGIEKRIKHLSLVLTSYLKMFWKAFVIDDKSLAENDKIAIREARFQRRGSHRDRESDQEEDRPLILERVGVEEPAQRGPFSRNPLTGKRTNLQKYHLAALVASLGLGIFLAVQVVPFVMAAATASLGLPFAVTVLLGAFAAAAVVAMTYHLLASLVTLSNIYRTRELLLKKEARGLEQDKWAFKNIHWGHVAYAAIGVIGVTAAVGASHLFFVPLVNTLTPVLGTGMATFAAVAVSASLAVMLMKFLPTVGAFIVEGVGHAKDKLAKEPTKDTSARTPMPTKKTRSLTPEQENQQPLVKPQWYEFGKRFTAWRAERAAAKEETTALPETIPSDVPSRSSESMREPTSQPIRKNSKETEEESKPTVYFWQKPCCGLRKSEEVVSVTDVNLGNTPISDV